MGLLGYLFKLAFFVVPMAVGAAFLARILTRMSISWAEKKQVVAEVDDRSSHTIPLPRVGGIGLVAGILLGFVFLAVMLVLNGKVPAIIRPTESAIGWLPLAGWVAAILLAFAMGFWDDRHSLPAIAKLVAQVAIAFIAPLCGLRFLKFHIPGMTDFAEIPMIAGVLLTAAWVFLMMNVVNFMDGINGLAGRFAQFTAVAALISPVGWAGWETMIPLAACLWGASEGFMAFNLQDAKTFMGDCGSQPLGVMIALLGVHLATLPTSYPVPFIGYLIIVSPFIFDVVYTLVRRVLLRKNILNAHREHLYQRHLIATGESHQNTRLFLEGHLIASAIIGAFYIHFYYQTAKTAGQVVLILAALASLVIYAYRVYAVEKTTPQEA